MKKSHQFLKIAGVKNIDEFYQKYPTEAAFFKAHPEAKNIIPKAQTGIDTGMFDEYSAFQTSSFPDIPQYQSAPGIIDGMGIGQSGVQPPNMNKNSEDLSKLGGALIGSGIEGFKKIKQQKQNLRKAEQMSGVTDLFKKASSIREQAPERRYVRPEDSIVNPNQLFPTYGVGTNVLAKNGAEIHNTFAPNDLYDDLGYEPLNESSRIKQYQDGGDLSGIFGESGMFGKQAMSDFAMQGGLDKISGAIYPDMDESGTAAIGGGIGEAAGTAIGGPLGGKIGKAAGQTLGRALDPYQNKIKKEKQKAQGNISATMINQGAQGLQNQYKSYMEYGGEISNPQLISRFGEYTPDQIYDIAHEDMDTLRAGGHVQSYKNPSERALQTYAMGGDIQTHWGGGMEELSQNPYMPNDGETVMFRGQSHDESDGQGNTGIGVTYGNNPVEVERGEPATKIGEDLVVYGNLQIPNQYVELFGKEAKGKKFKNYVADLSKQENKHNKFIEKNTIELDELDVNNPFDKLKMNALQANISGANSQLKEIADKKMKAASLQNAINDTAEEYGVDADYLAKGKIKIADQELTPIGKNGKVLKYATGGDIPNVDDKLDTFAQLLSNKGIDFKISSGYRKGATTAQGNLSQHGKGGALDITFPKLGKNAYSTLLKDPELAKFMYDNGLTAIDEYDPQVLKKTKGTGGHLHIGLDKGTSTSDKFRKDYQKLYNVKPASNNIQQADIKSTTNDTTISPKTGELSSISVNANPDYRQHKSGKYYGKVTEQEFENLKQNNPWYNWTDFDPNNEEDVMDFQNNANKLLSKLGAKERVSVDGKLGEETASIMSNYKTPEVKTIEKTPTTTITNTTEVPASKSNMLVNMLNQAIPYFRKSNAQRLDPNQLLGEMYALSSNQLEPVQAQTYQPDLITPYDISLQDVLNENQADYKASQRMLQNNPELLSALNAQKYAANQKVLGEQFRQNQAQRMGVYNQNLNTLNDARLKNLSILDNQYERQAAAKANTKATTQAALNSISSKYLQNDAANKKLQIYENLYNYRFDPMGRAINMNGLAQWNTAGNPNASLAQLGLVPIYDNAGNVTGYGPGGKKSDKKTTQTQSVATPPFMPEDTQPDQSRNGKKIKKGNNLNSAIVKAMKNL